ncbi:MAG: hypothetical protein ACRD88_01725, partial [Terriglobia bacterium]
MAVMRWGIGAVLIALFLLPFAVPERFRQTGEAAQQRPRRVYTNDDPPFNRSRSATPAPANPAPDGSSPTRSAE